MSIFFFLIPALNNRVFFVFYSKKISSVKYFCPTGRKARKKASHLIFRFRKTLQRLVSQMKFLSTLLWLILYYLHRQVLGSCSELKGVTAARCANKTGRDMERILGSWRELSNKRGFEIVRDDKEKSGEAWSMVFRRCCRTNFFKLVFSTLTQWRNSIQTEPFFSFQRLTFTIWWRATVTRDIFVPKCTKTTLTVPRKR